MKKQFPSQIIMSKVHPIAASSNDLSKGGDFGEENTTFFVTEAVLGITIDRLVVRNDLKQYLM